MPTSPPRSKFTPKLAWPLSPAQRLSRAATLRGAVGGPTPSGRGSHPAQIYSPEDIGPEIMSFLTIHPNLLDGELAKLHFGQPRRIISDGLVEITSFVTNHLFG